MGWQDVTPKIDENVQQQSNGTNVHVHVHAERQGTVLLYDTEQHVIRWATSKATTAFHATLHLGKELCSSYSIYKCISMMTEKATSSNAGWNAVLSSHDVHIHVMTTQKRQLRSWTIDTFNSDMTLQLGRVGRKKGCRRSNAIRGDNKRICLLVTNVEIRTEARK